MTALTSNFKLTLCYCPQHSVVSFQHPEMEKVAYLVSAFHYQAANSCDNSGIG